jgi:hypothetical protein
MGDAQIEATNSWSDGEIGGGIGTKYRHRVLLANPMRFQAACINPARVAGIRIGMQRSPG